MLKSLKYGINLDTVLVKNGFIQYSEFNPKTQKIAIIDLPHTEAELTNIKNRDLTPTDSLRLRAYTGCLIPHASVYITGSLIQIHFQASCFLSG